MKVILKVYDKQGGADLSSIGIDIDELIEKLKNAKAGGNRTEFDIPIMCDDWHHSGHSNPGGAHANHHGVLKFTVYQPRGY
jgi:hypothetical protein